MVDRVDRAAIVTGASSGIGLAIARMLAEDGHAVTLAARRPEKLQAACDELSGDGLAVQALIEAAYTAADQEATVRPSDLVQAQTGLVAR